MTSGRHELYGHPATTHEQSSLAIDPGFADLAEFVVNPAIGAGSRDAQRFLRAERERAVQHAPRLLAAGRSVLVQRYIDGVDERGETGLIFIDGHNSHDPQGCAAVARRVRGRVRSRAPGA